MNLLFFDMLSAFKNSEKNKLTLFYVILPILQTFWKLLTCQKATNSFLSLLEISSKLLKYTRLTEWICPAYYWNTPETYLPPQLLHTELDDIMRFWAYGSNFLLNLTWGLNFRQCSLAGPMSTVMFVACSNWSEFTRALSQLVICQRLHIIQVACEVGQIF